MPVLKSRISDLGPKAEFAIVVGLAFGLFVFGSLRHALFDYSKPAITASHLHHLIVYEVVMFFALWWFLRQRKWTAARLGAIPSLSDVPVGIGLSVATYIAYHVTWVFAVLSLPSAMKSVHALALIGGRFDLLTVLVVSIVNPIFEETFLCGYVVTVLAPVRSLATAVSVSVGIRALYHLYQGPLVAVGIIPVGLAFTWYYARTRRLWPVVVAHAIFDFVGLVQYT